MVCRPCVFAALVLSLSATAAAFAEEPPASDFFGFDPMEVIKIDQNAGPILLADVNRDGLQDLVAINNFKSRIEVHYQKAGAKPTDDVEPGQQVNEFPPHWRFRREFISVAHRLSALVVHDFDNDGLNDIIYAGTPPELVFVRQKSPGVFDVTRKHRVKDLAAGRNALEVGDVLGDSKPELLATVNGEIHVWTLDADRLGEPAAKLAAGAPMVAFFIDDFNGDSLNDIAGVIPDHTAPVRLWLGAKDGSRGVIGPQVRFEMPPLREFKPLHLPNDPAARIAVIERASKRLVLYNVATERITEQGDRDAAMRVYSFTDPSARKRSIAVADVDGDGLQDLLSTNVGANSVVVYRQVAGKGFSSPELYPSLSEMDTLVAGQVESGPEAEVFVMSEKEGVVGRTRMDAGRLPFPTPIKISDGYTPAALALVTLDHGPHLAVIAKDARNYQIDLIGMADGHTDTIKLGSLSRSPQTILALDADQDGRTDLLLFTPEKPMTMLQAGEAGFTVRESKDMGQFGFVSAATADNTAVFDVDGDGKVELLIADKNFVRAVRYEPAPSGGVSPGWQVVRQINANDSTAKLVSLAAMRDRIVAADSVNNRLIIMGPEGDAWRQLESLNVQGFSFTSIYAGQFSGDGQDNILAVGGDGFAVIRLAGDRVSLDEFAAWRTDKERRVQHELAAGDINSDGFTDLVSLDAGEQMCEIFTLSEARRLIYASAFKVFETKIFTSDEPREFEPRQVIIGDLTGDQAGDLVLLSHDRVLLYPQMTKTSAARAKE